MLKEFKAFVMRGNVLDLAVGIIIGSAFGKIVDSLVKDVLMPPIGILLGNIDFSNFFIVLKEGKSLAGPYPSLDIARQAGAVTLNLGIFFNTMISFFIIAFTIFLVLKTKNKIVHSTDSTSDKVTTKTCPHCYSTIALQATRCPQCTSQV